MRVVGALVIGRLPVGPDSLDEPDRPKIDIWNQPFGPSWREGLSAPRAGLGQAFHQQILDIRALCSHVYPRVHCLAALNQSRLRALSQHGESAPNFFQRSAFRQASRVQRGDVRILATLLSAWEQVMKFALSAPARFRPIAKTTTKSS